MPTKRAWIFLLIALALYFLANQTQVGWLYIISDGLVALLVVAFGYTRGMLKPVQAGRTMRNLSPPQPARPASENSRPATGHPADDLELSPPTFHEDDPLEITLQFSQHGFRPALLVGGYEECPFAPPADQDHSFFIPGLFKGSPLNLSYQTRCDRRGLYRFSKLPLWSSGPFGLFKTGQTLTVPGEILIYPSYYPLKRLRLLENKGFSTRPALRVGLSSEVIGARVYRPGDPLRRIHWRSTARTGELVVKEFADDDQLTLTVVLDLESGANLGRGKFSTFETAVRLAASFGFYASRRNIPFYLVGAGKKWRPPATPLSWEAGLNYLAKVQNDGHKPLADVISRLPALPFIVVLVSRPSPEIARSLAALHQKGARILAIYMTPAGTSPQPGPAVRATGLAIRTVSPHNWAEMLANL